MSSTYMARHYVKLCNIRIQLYSTPLYITHVIHDNHYHVYRVEYIEYPWSSIYNRPLSESQ